MKTELTLELERLIYRETHKMGVFGCFEVTIGWFGKERVDYITYDTKGVWRCYEIKISKSDFKSKAANSFLGHFNYYVMPEELYEQVKQDIAHNIGVYARSNKGYFRMVKRPKRCQLGVDEQILKNSLIRSLARDANKLRKSNNPRLIDDYKREISALDRRNRDLHQRIRDLSQEIYELRHPERIKTLGGNGDD
jgi:hypothetical protein